MTDEEKKTLKIFKAQVEKEEEEYFSVNTYTQLLYDSHKTVLNLIEKRQNEIENITQYAEWHISHITEDIKDYIDDDKKGNENIIAELKEQREHWKDIIRITKNEKTYIDYKD